MLLIFSSTCDSFRLRSAASLFRSVLLMYFCLRKVLSSSFLCSSENTALLRIPLRDLGLISADHIRMFAPSERENGKNNNWCVDLISWLSIGHWFLIFIGGLRASGPCAGCHNPKLKCISMYRLVESAQMEASGIYSCEDLWSNN